MWIRGRSKRVVPDKGALRCTTCGAPLDWSDDRARACRTGHEIICATCVEIFLLRTMARAALGSEPARGEMLDDVDGYGRGGKIYRSMFGSVPDHGAPPNWGAE